MADGINVIGTLTGAVGTVVAANVVVEALRRGGVSLAGYDLVRDTHGRAGLAPPPIPMVTQIEELPYKHSLFLDVVPAVSQILQEHSHFFSSQRRAFAFYYELTSIPLNWRPLLASFDILFAPSAFVKDAIAYSLNREALALPLVPLIERSARPRSSFHSPFRVLYSFDPLSAEDRKNPMAGLKAFSQAFAGRNDVELILKVWKTYKLACEIELQDLFHPNIRILENDLSYEQNLELTASADCYLSLHRGEGLGLALLESMALDTVVIATDYGGSRDFLDASSGFPIPYTLIPTATRHRLFSKEMLGEEGKWAEANVDAAAFALQQLVDDPSGAQHMRDVARHRYLARRNDFLSLGWLEPFLHRQRASTSIFSLDPGSATQTQRLVW